MTLPTFLIIGCGRSGTTSLYRYLRQHPQIFMCPVKEPSYFSWTDEMARTGEGVPWYDTSVKTLAAYEALFSGVTSETAIGEASPRYFFSPQAPERIHRLIPDARLVAILRHPAERAHAVYVGSRRDGYETAPTFEEAIRQCEEGKREKWPFRHYLRQCEYHRHIARYLGIFPRAQLRLYLFEDLAADAAALLRDLLAFLGVDSTFRFDLSRRYAPSGQIGNPFLGVLWRHSLALRLAVRPYLPEGLRDLATRTLLRSVVKPEMKPETRARLLRHYRDDTLRLQDLMGRDLSHWLE
jgi:hypothetical protein